MAQVIDQVAPGQSYLSNEQILIQAPTPVVVGDSSVTWQLLTLTGILLASGSGTVNSATANPSGLTSVAFEAQLTIPSTVPANPAGEYYILSYSINLSNGTNTVLYPYQRRLTVATPTFQRLGPSPCIELFGNNANLQLVLADQVSSLGYTIFDGNSQIVNFTSVTPTASATTDGYAYRVPFATSNVQNGAKLTPYLVFWQYILNGDPTQTSMTEMGYMYLITPKIWRAAKSLQDYIQRAVINLDQTEDVIFKPEDLMHWLVQGQNQFNTFGNPTNFYLTNASDQVMYYWVAFAAINALRSQFLVESLKSFNYGGQQVTLDVDHAAAFESLASTLEQQVAEECRRFKQILVKRGQIQGDGNVDPTALAMGAIGSVGISLSPVSNLWGYSNNSSWLGVGRII